MATTRPRKVYHPYCHLMNGERLYYFLIRTRTLSPKNRNFIATAATEALGKDILDTMCLHQVFGEKDMIVRVWASRKTLAPLLTCFRRLPNVEKVEVLLIREMLTCYQRQIENARKWSWNMPSDCLDAILRHDFPRTMMRTRRENRTESKKVRFFVFCERPYETRSSLFREVRDVLASVWHKEKKSQLSDFSIYSYSNRSVQGVLVKGDLDGNEFRKSSRDLTSFVDELLKLNCKTTTNICSETILDARDAVKEEGDDDEKVGGWAKVMANLLVSFASHPEEIEGHDLVSEPLKGATDFAGVSEESQENTVKYHHNVHSIAYRERAKRCDAFESLAAHELWNVVRHYHKDWWNMLEEMRIMYRWIADGQPKNDQIIAVMMRGYADIESRLSQLIRKLVKGPGINEVERTKLRKKMATLGGLADQPSLIEMLCDIVLEAKTEHFTLNSIAYELGILRKSDAWKQLSEPEKVKWRLFHETLHQAAFDRNDLMHGNVRDLFTPVESTRNKGKASPAWRTFVMNYLKLYLLFPMVYDSIQNVVRQTIGPVRM